MTFKPSWMLAALTLAATSAPRAQQTVPVYGVRIVNTFPHDKGAFTQGLIFENGTLYEGTGLEGQSELRQVDLTSGEVLRRQALPDNVFGEGLTSWRGFLVQLSWKNKTGYVYERDTFKRIRTFSYATEGWGLTQDGKNLILSDGSDTLFFLNPATYKVERTLKVTAAGQPVDNINELEFADGAILANVWLTSRIARIDPKSGRVTAWYDLSSLTNSIPGRTSDDVLNGIAHDAQGGRLFVTGKRWPKLFEVELLGPG